MQKVAQMSNNLTKALESISEENVAHCRKTNKKIELTEDVEIRNLLAGDYWKFVYTAMFVNKYHQDLISLHRRNLNALCQYFDEEYYTLRCIINALACKFSGEPASHNLDSLKEYDLNAATQLLIFSCSFGYYFWDIDKPCTSDEIIDFFIKVGSTPMPPLPFNNSDEQIARIATFKLAIGTIFTGRESFIEEMKGKKNTYKFELSTEESGIENKLKRLALQHQIAKTTVDQMHNNEPRTVAEVSEMIKMRKCVVQDQFSHDSIPARCIGLLLYEIMISSGKGIDDTINAFKSTDTYQNLLTIRLFKKSSNVYLSDKDTLTLKRWLKITQACIEARAVLPLK